MRRAAAPAGTIGRVAIPEFILDLRARIGTAPLWLSGVTAVILDGDRVLLIRRADTDEWAPVTGIIDPGEEPAIAAAREAMEETGVEIRVERLASVSVSEPVVYPNGDQAQYLDLTFRCAYRSGRPEPVDGEALEVAWFPLEGMPAMREGFVRRIRTALEPHGEAIFVPAAGASDADCR